MSDSTEQLPSPLTTRIAVPDAGARPSLILTSVEILQLDEVVKVLVEKMSRGAVKMMIGDLRAAFVQGKERAMKV